MMVFEDRGGGLAITQNSAIPHVCSIHNMHMQSAVLKNETALMLAVDL